MWSLRQWPSPRRSRVLFCGDFGLFADRVVAVQDDVEALTADFKGIKAGGVVGQGDEGGIQHAVVYGADQAFAYVFADV